MKRHTDAAAITTVQRKALAVRMRLAGHTFQQIAQTLGWKSKQAAFEAVKSALAETLQGPCDELRALEMMRLDALWSAQYPRAVAGDVAACGACLRIMGRRARLLGLDAPTHAEVTVAEEPARVEVTRDEVLAALAEATRSV